MAYTLVIAEKPSAAKRIASALAEGKVKTQEKNGVKYFEIKRGGKNMVVAPAVGHLFVLAEKNKGKWTYPVFNTKWKPVFEVNKKNYWSKKYYLTLKSLAKNADSYISATDYDIEGAVIAYNILKFLCGKEDAKRMRFSTLTKSDLVNAYEKASKHLDFGYIEAGLTRHQLDWFFGVNISRALTLALKAGGGFKVLSTGRVQGPTLKILDDRQEKIKKFKPKPYWEIKLNALISGQKITFGHTKGKFWKKPEAEKVVSKCKGQKALVKSVSRRDKKQRPPFPFDLTTMQREAYKNFGYSPKQTLDIAQSLYEKALISYPRTSSQKLSPKIGYKAILNKLSKQNSYRKLSQKILSKPVLKPNNGHKKDPAHPAIFPSGQKPKKLNRYQKKIYDLIVKRFLAVFADPAKRQVMKITLDVRGETFRATGTRTIEPGWIEFYSPYAKFKEQTLPSVKKGEEAQVKKLKMLDKETQPPKRYTQASVLKEMEKLGIGTKATRALILQTLYNRSYIREKSIEVTTLGEAVIKMLKEHSPEIVSVNLTRKLEKDMELIKDGKEKRSEVVERTRETLEKILSDFKKNENEIGKVLLKAVRKEMKEESTVGKCTCGGDLVIRMSRKKKRFIGCTNYPKCTETYSLPQRGRLTVTRKKCPKCGLYIISVKRRGKRPWKLCVRCGFVNKIKKKSKSKKKTKKKSKKEEKTD